MCMPRGTTWTRKEVSTTSTSDEPLLQGPWMLAHGVGTLRITDGMRALSGSLVTQTYYRFASVLTSQPGAWNASADTRSANGVGTNDVDISATTDQMWVQVGLAGKVTSGVGYALAGLRTQADGAAKIIASQTLQIQKFLNTSQTAYFPLGDPQDNLNLSGLMWAIVVTGVSGTITYQPCWREFAAIDSAPDAWTDLGSSVSDTGNDTANTGNIATTPAAGKALFQPGLKITTSAQATLQVLVSAKF